MNEITCEVCNRSNKHIDIYRIYKIEGRHECEDCLFIRLSQDDNSIETSHFRLNNVVYDDYFKELEHHERVETNEIIEHDDAFDDVEDYSGEPVDFDALKGIFGDIIKQSILNGKPEQEITDMAVIKNKGVEVYAPTKPKVMKDHLDKYSVGQNEAKKVLSVAVYNHFKRLKLQKQTNTTMKKNNILLAGPTGVGKTFITQLIADKMDVPFIIVDANSITQAGYVGSSVEDILENLYSKSGNDLDKAQKGIVLIDEIDKLCAKEGRDGPGSRDPSGEGAQQALLKLIEGGQFKVEISSGMMKSSIMFDTSDVLFIVAGAFPDIERIVTSREVGKNRNFLGGSKDVISKADIYKKITTNDYERFGIIPELLGRLPVKVSLEPLTEENLVDILSTVDNNLVDQYKLILKEDNVQLKVTKGALKQIANIAIDNNSGARGLQSVFEELLRDVMFECPTNDNIIDFKITKSKVLNISK